MSHRAITLFICFWKQIIGKEDCLSWKDDIAWSQRWCYLCHCLWQRKTELKLGGLPTQKRKCTNNSKVLGVSATFVAVAAALVVFVVGSGSWFYRWQRWLLSLLLLAAASVVLSVGYIDIRFAVWEASRYQGTFWHAICVNVNVKFSGGRRQAVLPVRMTSTWLSIMHIALYLVRATRPKQSLVKDRLSRPCR